MECSRELHVHVYAWRQNSMICFQLNIVYRWVRLKMYVAFTSVHVHVLYKKKQQQKPMPTCRIISPRIQQHNGFYEYHQCNFQIFFVSFVKKIIFKSKSKMIWNENLKKIYNIEIMILSPPKKNKIPIKKDEWLKQI